MIGWDVSVLTADDADARPLEILGVRTVGLEDALARPVHASCLQAIAVHADLYSTDARVRQFVRQALDAGQTDVRLWGEGPSGDLDAALSPLRHELSVAARAFKAQALAAAAVPPCPGEVVEVFRSGESARRHLAPVP
jgi:hypothetical protein